MKHLALLSALTLATLTASCERGRPASANASPTAATSSSRVEGEVVATVNNVSITREELPQSPHGGSQPLDSEALSRVIEDEVLAQYAASTGIDRDPTFRAELARAEASFRAWRRSQLVALVDRAQSNDQQITEAEARSWYESHQARARSEVRVAQVLVRDEASAAALLRELRSGTPFEDIARRSAPPSTDPADHPWEIGPLRWQQLPDPWRGPLDALQIGQTTDVIRGPNHRFWILKLLERHENPALTFEATKDTIMQVLREERATAARARLRETLRRAARVTITPRPVEAEPATPVAPAAPAAPAAH